MKKRVDAAQILTTSEQARKHYKEQEEIFMRQKGLHIHRKIADENVN